VPQWAAAGPGLVGGAGVVNRRAASRSALRPGVRGWPLGLWWRVAVLSAGGALGVNARFWLGLWVSRRFGAAFPWATLAINVSGSLAIGFLTAYLAARLPLESVRLFAVVGFLGGYTTFSSFAIESLDLWGRGLPAQSLAYMLGSVAAGFTAAALGVALGRLATAAP